MQHSLPVFLCVGFDWGRPRRWMFFKFFTVTIVPGRSQNDWYSTGGFLMSPAIAVLLYAVLWSWPGSQTQKPSEPAPTAKETAVASVEPGKAIFVERCAKCHDADANKTLPDGTTLLGRLAKSKDPEARIGTRIKDLQERRQVFQYLVSQQIKVNSAASPR